MIWFPVTKRQFWSPQNPLEMSTGNPSTEFCNGKADGNIPGCPFKYPLCDLNGWLFCSPVGSNSLSLPVFFSVFQCGWCDISFFIKSIAKKQKQSLPILILASITGLALCWSFMVECYWIFFFFITTWYFLKYALEFSLLFVYTWGNPEPRVAPLFHAKSSVWNIKVRQ